MSNKKKTLELPGVVGDHSSTRSSVQPSHISLHVHHVHDHWHDPPDPNKKAVCINSECVDGAITIAGLLKNLNIDCYSEDEAELKLLYSKPSCFLMLGKPGVGKTSLARRFAAEWKCLVINSTDIILENIELKSEIGITCVEILNRGEAIPDELVLKMIENKINSTEVAHHGYILDDFPCLSEDLLSMQDQLELIKSWKLKPDFIINLRIPEKDIERRRLNQKVDSFTGIIYTKEVYEPDKPVPQPVVENPDAEKGEDAVEEEADEFGEEETLSIDEHVPEIDSDIIKRLVKRPEDLPQQVEENLSKFKNNMLRSLEDYMGDHDQQYLLELDGNLSITALFKQLMQKLKTFVFSPAAVVTRLTDPDDEDITEDMETDDLMRALAPKQMVAPRFRWRRSKWLRNCPVALYEGKIEPGKPEFAVSFLDKVYCLSSAEALGKFMRNPRPYLVPKQPRTPCRISVVGQPFSGKTTLCHLLAQHYGAKVFDIHALAIENKLVEKKLRVEQLRIETTEKAIELVKNKIKKQLEAEVMMKEKERLAHLAAESEALRLEHERLALFEAEDDELWEDGVKKSLMPEDGASSDETVKNTENEDTKSSSPAKEGLDEKKKTDSEENPDADQGPEEQKEAETESQEMKKKEGEEDTLIDVEKKPEVSAEEKLVSDMIEIIEPQVDGTHPEVKAIVNVAVSLAEVAPINITPEYEAELLERTIQEWEKELRSTRHDGPLHGCWILDNFPETPEQWNACVERNVIPNSVYVLGDEIRSVDVEKLKLTCARYCLKNRDTILVEMNRRVLETDVKNQEARIEGERKKILEEERIKKLAEEEKEKQRLLNEEAKAAEAARQEALAQLRVNQVLWDTLAGELQTGTNFREMGLQLPRGPSFVTTLTSEFQDYSELYAALNDIENKKRKNHPKKHDHDATTADTLSSDGESGMGTPVQVSSNVLDDDLRTELRESIVETELEIPEKTELELLMETPEAKAFMEKMLHFEKNMNSLLAAIAASSSVEPFRIAFVGSSIEAVLESVIKNEEKQFRYHAWEMGQVDLDEIEEDIDAEAAEQDNTEAIENKDEDAEEFQDPNRGIKKFLGETNYFDPVSLQETDTLYPGNPEIASMYREKMYYFSTTENRDKFIEAPLTYLSVDKPQKIPPLRLLMLGSKGSGKSLHGSYLAEKLGIFHISFRERLQELIIAKTKKKVGPEFEEDNTESIFDESESQIESNTGKPDGNVVGEKHIAGQTPPQFSNIVEDEDDDDSYDGDADGSQDDEDSHTPGSEEIETVEESKHSLFVRESTHRSTKEDTVKTQESVDYDTSPQRHPSKQTDTNTEDEKEEMVELTEDEEAIKANLESNEPLPLELLESILKPFWTMEPYKSVGFILEGFPRTADEVRYLQEAGLFPDAAIFLQVSENDIIRRLLPPKLDIWRAKRARRLARKARIKAKAQAKRNALIMKRREALIKERDERRAARKSITISTKEEDEDVEEETEAEVEETEEGEEEDDIEAILAEEFEEEEEAEEEEEEELEEDAIERMKNDLNEIYADEHERISGVMETLEEVLIPCLDIAAGRKPHIVRYIINKKLKPFVEFRHSIFERVYPISQRLAKVMLQVGFKQPSRFGRWDPVQLLEGKCIQPLSGPDHPSFACIYRSYIYYLSSQSNRVAFMQDPLLYLNQESPKPVVPLRIAIIGPPKSGKTTLANRFVEDYGVVRLSIGEAMRQILAQHPKSELAQQMKWNLIRGRVIPDELQIQALDVALLDVKCQTRGYVLDGYPMNMRQIELMTEHNIIPVKVIELELSSKEVLVRGVKDRLNSTKTVVLHDSSQILAIKLSCYQRTIAQVQKWYQTQHKNYVVVPADKSKWWVVDAVHAIATSSIKRIQDYLHRTSQGRSAGIAGLCITPKEFCERIGDFGQYCPVSLAERNELVDCSGNETLEFAAEFRGRYYKMAGPKELEMFLANPEKYVPPLAPFKLPPKESLPHRISKELLESRQSEILGYCPVTYLDGNLRYEALVPGNPQFAVEYKGKIYMMESEEKLLKFMKQPEKYANLTLPHKLPPAPEDMPLQNLPMLGFMEQTCAIAMIKALTAAGNVKPKYPFISSTRSALIYTAYHLKAFNPKSSPYIRKKYKQKLQQFQETCELIKYLGNNMTVRYRDPNERPKDFDNKLEMFFALRGVEPTPTWLK